MYATITFYQKYGISGLPVWTAYKCFISSFDLENLSALFERTFWFLVASGTEPFEFRRELYAQTTNFQGVVCTMRRNPSVLRNPREWKPCDGFLISMTAAAPLVFLPRDSLK